MIKLSNKKDCCGCHACVSICPKSCISMKADEEGFLYPYIDEQACIDCGLCEHICPMINQGEPRKPIEVYAAKCCDDTIRKQSSSGGIFTVVAEEVIAQGGVVFGARFNEKWEVIHDWTDKIEELSLFRGSKYVQSRIGNTYKEAEQFLKQDRYVLFTGTPCQIAGLKKFLRKEYNNLLTIDVVCHGVPSPLVWQEYLKSARYIDKKTQCSLSNPISAITDIAFRDKTMGWKKFSFRIDYTLPDIHKSTDSPTSASKHHLEPFYDNLYMKGFLQNIYLRPSCYACKAKSGKSGSDLAIADFWGIEKSYPELDDDKGISALLVYNGNVKLSERLDLTRVEYNDILSSNSMIEKSVDEPQEKALFWQAFPIRGFAATAEFCKRMERSFLSRVVAFIKRKLGV